MGTVVNQPRDDDGKWTAGLDHGVLNIPLSKRGNIDNELDKYKANQARIERVEAKSVAQQKKEDKAQAKALYEKDGPAMLDRYGPKFGRTQIRDTLTDMVKWEPRKFLSFHAKYTKETAAQTDRAPT